MSRASVIRPREILLLGIWLGLLTGLAEALVLTARHFVFHQLIYVSAQYGWMAPVADVLFFLLPAILLALLALLRPGSVAPRLAVWVFLTGGFGALLMMYPHWHPVAALVLAAGIGFQLSARVASERVIARVAGSLGWTGLLVAALCGLSFARSHLAARRSLASLSQARAGAPNVLLIILDTVRALNLSLYGYPRPTTPNLERVAREGARFDEAFSTAPWTLPSHASLLTGRYPHELSADWVSPLDRKFPTIAEEFEQQGYQTAGFVANVGYLSWEFGLDRGFIHYQDYLLRLRDMVGTTSIGAQLDRNWRIRSLFKTDQHLDRIAAPEISGPFLHWVDAHPGRPFFAFLNYYDAHGPYLPPHPWDRKFSARGRKNDLSPLHRFFAGPRRELPDSAVIQAEIDQYDGALAYLDDQLGRLFAELARRGILDHTVVLITADHGEEFGEHGVFDHGNSLYRPAVQVPLIIRFPSQVPAGVVIDSAVTLRDVAATLASLAGLGPAGQLPGQSLARFWRKDAQFDQTSQSPVLSEVSKGIRTPPWYPVSRGDMRSLVGFGYRYILGGDGTEQLFSLDDVREQTPLADSTARLATFREQLRLWPWATHGAGWTGVP